jgi:hypothetical protein
MKQNKWYVAPKVEVIEIEPQGILCTSAPAPEEFTGTGFKLDVDGGTW